MIEQLFCDAYNARDLGALTALLAEEATTELVGSGFAEEQGPAAIAAGSLAHLLEGGLKAEVLQAEAGRFVAFRQDDGGLDSLAALTEAGGRIARLRYHTRWHDEAFVKDVEG